MTRSPDVLVSLLTGLDVRNNPTFIPGLLMVPAELVPGFAGPQAIWNGKKYAVIPYTRCSGFAGVVFVAMGCIFPATKTANEQLVWLAGDDGRAAAWRECSLLEAIGRANNGFPLAAVAHEDPHGHIVVGRPNLGDLTNLYCAAAGAFNTSNQRAVDQFGHLAGVARYFTHD